MAKTFQLKSWSPPIPVTVADGLPINIDEAVLLKFPAFKNWLHTLKENLSRQRSPGHTFELNPWRLTAIKVHSVHPFSEREIGFMTIEAFLVQNKAQEEVDGKDGTSKGSDQKKLAPKKLERVVFLRGGSVAVLMILRPKDSRNERYVILTEQPRVGACSTTFLEIPAGMLDDSPEVKGKAIQEIEEETNLKVRKEELIDLTALALKDEELKEVDKKEQLQPAIYMSPANLDEFIPLLLWEKDLDRKQIEALKGRLTGERTADEMITLRIIDYEDLWKKGARDAKTLAAWALYEGLNRSGKIEEQLHDIRIGKYER